MRKKIGALEVLLRPAEDDGAPAVVLLHGFGADCTDLYPLADALDPDRHFNFYFPQAPLEVPIGPMWTGRAWFPISVRDVEKGVDFTEVRPQGMDAAMEALNDFIFHLNPSHLVLGGFSQGAMLATEYAMQNPGSLTGLIILSGSLLDQKRWSDKAQGLSGQAYFQSHGQQDPVLPFQGADRLNALFKKSGWVGSFHSFSGGHEIPRAILARAATWLHQLQLA